MSDGGQAERFTALRPLLFTVAYEILGSAADADDVLQESYLRWARVDPATVRDPRVYLVRLVTRQALNARRASLRRREDYVGPWLPEPLLVDDRLADDDVVLAESVSMAMLVLLETLGPEERVVFVLREVFAVEVAEVAAAVGRSEAAVRQIAHRARAHVRARRPRFAPVAAARALERFTAAAASGDLAGLLAVLAPDVVWTADGGGRATAARRPVVGAERAAATALGIVRLLSATPGVVTEFRTCNGGPALIVRRGTSIEAALLVDVDGELITRFWVLRNPAKLAGLTGPRTVTRSRLASAE